VWLVLLTGSLFFSLAILEAPLALARGNTATALSIYEAFSHLCHQLPERSFYIEGQKFAVCARCTGIYSGFVLGVLAYPLVRRLRRTDTPERKWLLLAALPLAVDFSLTFAGIWENTHTSRLLTGMLLGAMAVFYVLPGLVDLALNCLWIKPPVTVITGSPLTSAPSDYSAPQRRI
jgi:uncharacterized membrane protein